jgi:ketosteroid isomerase-like protein
MSHIDKHKAAYEAFAAGEFDKAFKDLADDAVFHGVAKGVPFGDDYKGVDAIKNSWLPAVGETLEGMAMDPAKFIEDGDWVVVYGHQTSTVNGHSISADFAHIWRWDAGEIAEAWFFGDSAQVAAALQ